MVGSEESSASGSDINSESEMSSSISNQTPQRSYLDYYEDDRPSPKARAGRLSHRSIANVFSREIIMERRGSISNSE